MNALQQELEALLQALKQQLPEPEVAPSSNALTIDEAQLLQVTRKLRELCEEMDSDACAQMDQHRALLATAYPAHISSIEKALKAYEFEEAIELLSQALATRSHFISTCA